MVDAKTVLEDQFLLALVDFAYGQKTAVEISALADKVPWAKGWPENDLAFWNVETFLWERRISKDLRLLIEDTLNGIRFEVMGVGALEDVKGLDLGCGAYSYGQYDVGFDFSRRMLDFNDKVSLKVEGDLNKILPFDDHEFLFISACFVLNYLDDVSSVLLEIVRVLKNGGVFVAVLSSTGVSFLHSRHEKHKMDAHLWKECFLKVFSKVECFENKGISFFVCRK